MERGKVTVVLPIYNVASYLNRCIESIVNQTYQNLEIILVDDGSPDECPAMCDCWAEKDARIKVIHKENAGLGMARNTGIDHATGEYVCFVDSDDYIALDTIEKTYALARKVKADIVAYGYTSVQRDGTRKKACVPQTEKELYEGSEILDYILPNMLAPDTATGHTTNLWMSMCGALFSAELFERAKWRMVSEREIISEDVYSLLRLYKYVERVVVIPEAFYDYCENAVSLTHTLRPDRFAHIKHFYEASMEACKELGYSDGVKQRIAYVYFSYVIADMKMIAAANIGKREKKLRIKEIIEDSHLHEVLSQMDMKHESFTRKALAYAIRRKSCTVCYLMARAKA